MEKVKTVRVTTKAELDAALPSAETILVEGTEEAVAHAAELAGLRREDRVLLTVGLAIALLAIAVGALAQWIGPGGRAALMRLHLPSLPAPPEAFSPTASRAMIAGLAWPFLALLAVVAFVVLLRQAILSATAGAEWKVVEQGRGRIVIARARTARSDPRTG